ncbi:periplasmic heavy metal sensor [candidate division WOR-3 bacterium]|nr:periplasmic heavy metal sensor [candidate division WOR-3 bacterium]
MKRTALTVALVLLVGLAMAQPRRTAGKCGHTKAEKPAMPEMTAEQLDKMDGLRMSHLKETAPLRTDLDIKKMELAALWRAEKLDAKKVVAKVKEIGDLRLKLQLAEVNHQLGIYDLLTPEQRKAWRPPMMGGRGMKRGMGRRMMRGAMIHEDMDGPMGACGPADCHGCGKH